MYTRILVPLDGSEAAEAALPHARSLASRLHAEVVLLRVEAPIPNLPSSRYPAEIGEEAARYLRSVAEPMILKGLKVRTLVEYGDPGEVVSAVAAAHRVDLIVVADDGGGGVWRRVPGRLVSRILAGSRVPTLVVRGG